MACNLLLIGADYCAGVLMGIDDFLFTGSTMKVLERSLDVQAKRVEAASSNIANIDTPNYRAVEVDFRNVYEGQMDKTDPEIQLATQPGHIGASITESEQAPILLKEKDVGAKRLDGNNVDLDMEMSNLAQAQLQYSASVTALSRKLAILAEALTDKLT